MTLTRKKFESEFDVSNRQAHKIMGYLEKNVGPRRYYLASQMVGDQCGGDHWMIKMRPGGAYCTVSVDDPKLATYLILLS